MVSKVWGVMNDLEMVTSKIVSAREIIDTAAEAIQRSEYDKAETLAMAAYEFLGYYLDEFDSKFKLAWQETVVKQKKEEEDAYEAVMKEREYYEPSQGSWNSFWEEMYYPEEYKGSTVSSVQYTEEELNAMCDAAENREIKKNSWIVPVSDDFTITFPDDLLDRLAWKEGDVVEWIDQGDGSFKLVKKEAQASWVQGNELFKTKTYDEMVADGWEMTDDGFWIKSELPSSVIKSDEC